MGPSADVMNTGSGNGGGKVVVTVTTTIGAHQSVTTTALLASSTSAHLEWGDWTYGYRIIVVLAVLAAGFLAVGAVVFLWQGNKERGLGAGGDVEEGDRRRRVLELVAVGQREGSGVICDGWSVLGGGRGAEVHGGVQGSSRSNSTSGEGEGQSSAQWSSSRSSSISSGNSSSRGNGDVTDNAADGDNSNAGSSSSYVSAVEYRDLSPAEIKSVHLSRSTTSSSGPTGPYTIFNPTSSLDPWYTPSSSGPSKIVINPFALQLPDPAAAASAGSASAVEPNGFRETRELGGYRPFPSRHSPSSGRSGSNTVGPVLALELKAIGESVRGATGPEQHTGQLYVPWTTGSLQERLLGKYPARWG